jgi:ABC-type Na+ efflux pump permease subunit
MLFLARVGWFRLAGPIFAFDLIRTARRGSYLTIRLLYPLLVFLLLLIVFAVSFNPQLTSQKSSANFCVTFFCVFMLFNILAIFLLTPAYAAGALAEEKKHQTLDALLASDLRDHEIVLGTYLSRITKLGLIFLSPLPIFSFLQFLGGMEPLLIVAGFAFTTISMCSLAAVSVFCSVRAKNPRDALVKTYASTVVLTLALTAFWGAVQSVPGWKYFPGSNSSLSIVNLDDVANWLNFGNPIVLALQLIRGISTGSTLDKLLPVYLGGYALVHAGIIIGSLSYAVWTLRRFALGEDGEADRNNSGEGIVKQWLRTRWCELPWIASRPMLWKELLVDRQVRRGWFGRLLVGLGIVGLVLPILHLNYFFQGMVFPLTYVRHAELINMWLRLLCAVFGTIALVQTLAAATGGIAGEREKQTLEELLVSPLTNRAIFFAKWQAALCRSGSAWKALLGLWCVGLWTGSIHWVAILAFCVCWLSYAAFLSSLGVWFSVVCRTTRQATVAAFLSLSVLLGCTILCAYNLAERYMPSHEAIGLIPIANLIYMSFSPMEWTHWSLGNIQFRPGIQLAALAFWWISAWGLYLAARSRFGLMTGRIEGDLETPGPPDLVVASENATDLGASSSQARPAFPWAATVQLSRQGAWLAFMLLPMLVLAGWYEVRVRQAGVTVRGLLSSLDRADPGWRDYVPKKSRGPTVVRSPAAQLLLKQALALTPANWLDNDYDTVLRSDCPDQENMPGDSLRAIRNHSQAASAAIEEARKLCQPLPVARPGNGEEPATISPGDWWKIDRLLVTDAYQQLADRRFHEAMQSCSAILGLAQVTDTESDGSLAAFGWSQRNSSIETVLRLMARLLAQGELNELDLKQIQTSLAKQDQTPLDKILRKERARLIWLLVNQPGTPELASVPFIHDGELWPDDKYNGVPQLPNIVELQFYGTLDCLDVQRAEIFQLLTDCINGASTAFSAPPARAWRGSYGSQLDYYLWQMQQSALYFATVRCQVRATSVALALERYRIAHGAWPATLNELTPHYLESIPVGSFDGQPLIYKRVKDGVVVYAVGADRVDRGGTFARSRWFLGRNDIGVRLWDPANRQVQEKVEKP